MKEQQEPFMGFECKFYKNLTETIFPILQFEM